MRNRSFACKPPRRCSSSTRTSSCIRVISLNRRAAKRLPPGKSLPQDRMLVQYVFADRWSLNRAKQCSRRPQIVRAHAQAHDLSHRGIAQQLVGHLDGDLHRGLCGALVTFAVVIDFCFRAVGTASQLCGAIGGGTADFAYPVRRLNIADRPLDLFVPEFLALGFLEPPHLGTTQWPMPLDKSKRLCSRSTRPAGFDRYRC